MRRSTAGAVTCSLLLGAALMSGSPAAASGATNPRVVASLLYLNRTAGTVDFVFRTDRQLPAFGASRNGELQIPAAIAGANRSSWTISAARHCYDVNASLDVDGKLPNGKRVFVGDRLLATVGNHGSIFRSRLVVRPSRYTYPRGLAIGCADRIADVVIMDLFYEPWVKPGRWFFTANSGPYLKDLRWSGWATQQAVGDGTYVSDCASCGPKQILKARFVLSKLVVCKPFGAQTYQHARLEKLIGGKWKSETFSQGC